MPHFTRRRALALTLGVAALPVWAAPVAYRLDPAQSTVGFGVDLSGQVITGAMPVQSAELMLDFDQISNSRVDVTLDAAGTRMGVFFATDAVRGPTLLDTARHPTLSFRSTAMRQGATPAEAEVDGIITVKGVSGPVTLRTVLTQDRATVGQANPDLVFTLRARIDRHAFGISAYRNLVGPQVSLDIRASIRRA